MVKKIGVLLGGMSAESKVSLMSGNAVCKSLERLGYDYVKINPTHDLAAQLKMANPDVVINSLHGTYGEDGSIAGLLEVMNIPYSHSGVMASAIAMNKNMTRQIMQSNGIRVPQGGMFNIQEVRNWFLQKNFPISVPFIIKPVQQGSSVGVYIYNNNDSEFLNAINEINWTYGDDVIIEKFIPGKELSTAVVDGKALGTLELVASKEFYDYTAKYTDGVTTHIYPAEVPAEIAQEAKDFAQKAHHILGCRTISRSDFRYDANGDGKLYFLEINTHPGFTPLSILPEIASNHGISFDEIVGMLIRDAKCEIKA